MIYTSRCWTDDRLCDAASPHPLFSVLLQKENIGDLLIVNAQLSQAGMYTCTAQTVVDSAAAAAKLVVRGELVVAQRHWLLRMLGI